MKSGAVPLCCLVRVRYAQAAVELAQGSEGWNGGCRVASCVEVLQDGRTIGTDVPACSLLQSKQEWMGGWEVGGEESGVSQTDGCA